MERETPGCLRPTGGTKRFRRNCRLLAEHNAVVVTDRNGKTTRFPLDGSEDAPKEMMSYLGPDLLMLLDGKGRGIVRTSFLLWDAAENAQFCDMAGIEKSVTNTYAPAALRPDAVRLEEPGWLRRYVVSAPYVFAAGVLLAPIGRTLDLPLWLVLPFIPWLLMYPLVRAMGYFAPQRMGLADIERQHTDAERAAKVARKGRRRKAPTS
jgi:hypothetical protein